MKLDWDKNFPGLDFWVQEILSTNNLLSFPLGAFNLLFFPMQFIWPVNTDKMWSNTYIYIF